MNAVTLEQKILEELHDVNDPVEIQVEFRGPDRHSVYDIAEFIGLRYTPRGVAVLTLVVTPESRVDRWRERD